MEYFLNQKLNYQLNELLNKKNRLMVALNLIKLKKLLFFRDGINYLISSILKKFIDHNYKNYSNSILLINTEKMGDIFISVDFLNSLVHSNKFEKKYILIQEEYSNIIKKLGLDFVTIGYNKLYYRLNPIYRYKLLNKLSKLSVKVIVNISPERGSLNDELTLIPNSEYKIALKPKSLFMTNYFCQKNNLSYTRFVDSDEKNIYELYIRTLNIFDIKLINWDKSFINLSSIDKTNFVLIAPSASDKFRNWDSKYFQKLTAQLSHKIKIVLIGTEKQKKLLEFIKNGNENVIIKVQLNLDQIIDLFLKSKLFIGLDSGMSHLAILLNKKMIAIIGGGKYGQFFPYKKSANRIYLSHEMDCFGCNWICKYQKPYCINSLSVEKVLSNCYELIEFEE